MALLVTKQLQYSSEIVISGLYIRFEYKVNQNGDKIQIASTVYPDKSTYLTNPWFVLKNIGVNKFLTVDYNREVNGDDVLLFVHNKFIDLLTTDKYKDTESIDPDTGQTIINTELIEYKFCDINEIEIDII